MRHSTPLASARKAGLRHVSDSRPGFRRERSRGGFVYRDPGGRLVRDRRQLQRIAGLAIPPAWEDVWISPDPRGHLQATGRDSRGRKQYRYHPRWRLFRDESKFNGLAAFGRALPRIRRRVKRDLGLPGLPRRKVIATVIRLLQTTLARIGNEEYARANHSFGLTTLRDRHVEVSRKSVQFRFVGKGGKEHRLEVSDPRMARIVKRCRDLPGYELFQYVDAKGRKHSLGSSDVNDYLRKITGEEFSAKDFRTWAATTLSLEALGAAGGFDSKAQAQRNLKKAILEVSARLGNTPAICKKSYIHPAIIDGYLAGSMRSSFRRGAGSTAPRGLSRSEAAVVAILERVAPSV